MAMAAVKMAKMDSSGEGRAFPRRFGESGGGCTTHYAECTVLLHRVGIFRGWCRFSERGRGSKLKVDSCIALRYGRWPGELPSRGP